MAEKENASSDAVKPKTTSTTQVKPTETPSKPAALLGHNDKYTIKPNPETGDPWLYGPDGDVIAAWQNNHWYDDLGEQVDNLLPAGLKPDAADVNAPPEMWKGSSQKAGTSSSDVDDLD